MAQSSVKMADARPLMHSVMEYGLDSIAQALVAENKGILAADESTGTIKKRFDTIQLESNTESRRAYRELLFTTDRVEDYISGVILFDETIRQAGVDGTPFPQVLEKKGIIPGIKVDKGAKDLAGFPGEKVTEGLDGLRDRFHEYHELGARFSKWRAVITIGDAIPSQTCIDANAHALVRYAALSQEAGLVPIVEPEVLMDGDHDISRCARVTEATLQALFSMLHDHGVVLEGMLLKPNMIISGKECPEQASVAEVAEATVRSLRRTVPSAVPGVVFLSGGQSPEQATVHLNAMNAMGPHPWELSFSYGRALQEPVLKTWMGNPANVPAAQMSYYHRAKCNGAARTGTYTPELESEAA
jgi:fructose-bisphosphate aldolase class I